MSIQEKAVQAGLVVLGATLCTAAGWTLRGRSASKSLKEMVEKNNEMRRQMETLLKVMEIEAARSEAIIKDLGGHTNLSRDEMTKKLKSHKLNQKQIDSIIDVLYPKEEGGVFSTSFADLFNKSSAAT